MIFVSYIEETNQESIKTSQKQNIIQKSLFKNHTSYSSSVNNTKLNTTLITCSTLQIPNKTQRINIRVKVVYLYILFWKMQPHLLTKKMYTSWKTCTQGRSIGIRGIVILISSFVCHFLFYIQDNWYYETNAVKLGLQSVCVLCSDNNIAQKCTASYRYWNVYDY